MILAKILLTWLLVGFMVSVVLPPIADRVREEDEWWLLGMALGLMGVVILALIDVLT